MENAAIDLNGGDVWDDSALIESWNDALQEYKVFIFCEGLLSLY